MRSQVAVRRQTQRPARVRARREVVDIIRHAAADVPDEVVWPEAQALAQHVQDLHGHTSCQRGVVPNNLPEPLWLVGPVLGIAGGQGVDEFEGVHPAAFVKGLEVDAAIEPVGLAFVFRVELHLVRRRHLVELVAHRVHVPHHLLGDAMVHHLEEAVLLAGVKDGAADLVAALGHVNDRQGDIRAG